MKTNVHFEKSPTLIILLLPVLDYLSTLGGFPADDLPSKETSNVYYNYYDSFLSCHTANIGLNKFIDGLLA